MNRQEQIIVLYVLPFVAVILSLFLHANYLVSLFFFWGIPSLMLSFWGRRHVWKAALFSAIGTAFLMPLDLIFYLTKQWYVVTVATDYRLFGVVAWEDVLYFFLWLYFPILF